MASIISLAVIFLGLAVIFAGVRWSDHLDDLCKQAIWPRIATFILGWIILVVGSFLLGSANHADWYLNPMVGSLTMVISLIVFIVDCIWVIPTPDDYDYDGYLGPYIFPDAPEYIGKWKNIRLGVGCVLLVASLITWLIGAVWFIIALANAIIVQIVELL